MCSITVRQTKKFDRKVFARTQVPDWNSKSTGRICNAPDLEIM